jgi:acetyl esterase
MAWFWDQYLPDTSRRSEILAYAAKLRAAGVPVTAVRYGGIIHDFVMLHPLAGTHAARAATVQGATFLQQALHGA